MPLVFRFGLVAGILGCLLCIAGCQQTASEPDWRTKDFERIIEAARGTTVRWYMYGGWPHVNEWVDTYVAPAMQERYGISVKRVPMNAPVFVNKLINEKSAGKDPGTIDLVWINGENFKATKNAGALWGPFAEQLPNWQRYVDPSTVAQDFGFPTKGYEAPWGRAQFVLIYDAKRTPNPPRSAESLRRWIQDHPGRFTYPQPPDFTGSAFVRQLFYATTGGHEQYMDGFNATLYARNAPRLWEYLNGIEPSLWQQGRTYPQSSAALDTLFARGEVDFSMSYHPPHAQNKILDGTFPASVRTVALANNSIANTHYTAIPFNAPNKPGAMVLANFLLSPTAQLSKYKPENWGDFPAIDLDRLDQAQRRRFEDVDLGPATLSAETLAEHAVPEIPIGYLEAIEADWKSRVLTN